MKRRKKRVSRKYMYRRVVVGIAAIICMFVLSGVLNAVKANIKESLKAYEAENNISTQEKIEKAYKNNSPALGMLLEDLKYELLEAGVSKDSSDIMVIENYIQNGVR